MLWSSDKNNLLRYFVNASRGLSNFVDENVSGVLKLTLLLVWLGVWGDLSCCTLNGLTLPLGGDEFSLKKPTQINLILNHSIFFLFFFLHVLHLETMKNSYVCVNVWVSEVVWGFHHDSVMNNCTHALLVEIQQLISNLCSYIFRVDHSSRSRRDAWYDRKRLFDILTGRKNKNCCAATSKSAFLDAKPFLGPEICNTTDFSSCQINNLLSTESVFNFYNRDFYSFIQTNPQKAQN